MNPVRASAVGCLVVFMIACSYPGNQPAEAAAKRAESALEAPKDAMQTAIQASGIDQTFLGEADGSESWAEFISLQAPSDQAYLEELDRRYFGVMSFLSEEERDYMLRAGFPTPGEWLAAKKMTDPQLQARADAGDFKAAGILADRMSLRLETLVALDEKDPEAVEDSERVLVAAMAVTYATQAMQTSRSPFGLYVEGMVKSSIFNSWEPMTAAMIEATRRGDPRVQRLIEELHARHPVQDIGAIHASLKSMADDRR